MDEADAFAAWCLSEVPRTARIRDNARNMCVGFECPNKYQGVLLNAFQSRCSRDMRVKVYLNQSPDSATLEFTWPKGSLRLDPLTTL